MPALSLAATPRPGLSGLARPAPRQRQPFWARIRRHGSLRIAAQQFAVSGSAEAAAGTVALLAGSACRKSIIANWQLGIMH